jgi:hypothetical protein
MLRERTDVPRMAAMKPQAMRIPPGVRAITRRVAAPNPKAIAPKAQGIRRGQERPLRRFHRVSAEARAAFVMRASTAVA